MIQERTWMNDMDPYVLKNRYPVDLAKYIYDLNYFTLSKEEKIKCRLMMLKKLHQNEELIIESIYRNFDDEDLVELDDQTYKLIYHYLCNDNFNLFLKEIFLESLIKCILKGIDRFIYQLFELSENHKEIMALEDDGFRE